MDLVSSASRLVRKMGQVRVLGLSSEILAGNLHVPVLVQEVLHVVSKRDEIRLFGLAILSAEEEHGKFESPINVLKIFLRFSKS